MLGYLTDTLMNFFRFVRGWISGEIADYEDSTIDQFSFSRVAVTNGNVPVDCPDDLFVDSTVDFPDEMNDILFQNPDDDLLLNPDDDLLLNQSNDLLVESLVHFQDNLLLKIPLNGVAKKLNRETIEILNHIINIKVSDLIERMNMKHTVHFNTVLRPTINLSLEIEIDGSLLIRWFMDIMEFNPDEASYMAYLLSSHHILFRLVNHYLTELNIGYFHRCPMINTQEQPTTSTEDYKAHLNDYDFAIYLYKRATEGNFHGDLLSYEVGQSAKGKVDVDKWKFKLKISNM